MKRVLVLLSVLLLTSCSAGVTNTNKPCVTKDDIYEFDGKRYINFGTYEQDNNPATRDEPIAWLVLEEKAHELTLISGSALDYKAYYNESQVKVPYSKENYENIPQSELVTWENSSLRQWLNGEFYSLAFNESEKKTILKAQKESTYEVYWDYQNSYSKKITTLDSVWLLSLDDFDNYSSFLSGYLKFSKYLEDKYAYEIRHGYNDYWLSDTYNHFLYDDGEYSIMTTRARVAYTNDTFTDFMSTKGESFVYPCLKIKI